MSDFKTKLFNVGFLNDDSYSRYIQGLPSQKLTNNCFIGLNKTENNYQKKYKNLSQINYSKPFLNNGFYGNYSITKSNMLANPYFNNEKFPLLMPYVTYDNNTSVEDNCPCLDNLKTI